MLPVFTSSTHLVSAGVFIQSGIWMFHPDYAHLEVPIATGLLNVGTAQRRHSP
jgi:hypothetical protein